MLDYICKNGIRIVFDKTKTSSTYISCCFNTGFKNESKDIAHIGEHILFSRLIDYCKEINSSDIMLDKKFNAYTCYDYTSFWIRTLNKYNIDPVLVISKLIENIYNGVNLNEKELEIEKSRIYKEKNYNNISAIELIRSKILNLEVTNKTEILLNKVSDYINNSFKKDILLVVIGNFDDYYISSIITIIESLKVKMPVDKITRYFKNNIVKGKVKKLDYTAIELNYPQGIDEYITTMTIPIIYKHFLDNININTIVESKVYSNICFLLFIYDPSINNKFNEEESNLLYEDKNKILEINNTFIYNLLIKLDNIDNYAMWIIKSIYYFNKVISTDEIFKYYNNFNYDYILKQLNKTKFLLKMDRG